MDAIEPEEKLTMSLSAGGAILAAATGCALLPLARLLVEQALRGLGRRQACRK